MRTILTDIEGTTSSIAFVKDVLFPYARSALPDFIARHRQQEDVRKWFEQAAAELGSNNDEAVVSGLQSWIDQDRKHTALKALQGLIWREGYQRGDYQAHFYPDASRKLNDWAVAGHPIYVYSSGSVPAQQLFFAHSEAGDLRPLIRGWFDTEIGGKREADSYRRILDRLQQPASDVLFLSDVVEELDAAQTAGLSTILLDRPSDYAQPRLGDASHGHRRVLSFDDITLD